LGPVEAAVRNCRIELVGAPADLDRPRFLTERQGETLFEMRWRTDFERAVIAVIDYLEGRPEIDRARIGIIGRSMGGFYAPKTAAIDKRIKAVVAWGAMYHLRNLAEVRQVVGALKRPFNVVTLRANPYAAPYLAPVSEELEAVGAGNGAGGTAEQPDSEYVSAEAGPDGYGRPYEAAAPASEFVSAET